ncbi:MAG: hypothetical protein Q7W51_03640 [Coriobacteriia bacterium]|nr:hypothetical protein [Coriobacteriia bacterium]
MDGTPYPPPTPEVPPAGAPQAPYPPAAPQAQYDQQQYPPATPQPQYQQPQPPKKKKTGLIIGIVVGVLLLCCVGSGVAAYLIFRAAEDEVTNTLETTDEWETNTLDLDSDSNDEASTMDTGWEDFQPEASADNGYGPLEAFHEEVLDEAVATHYPDLVVKEALVHPSTEYTTDTLVARATLADDPNVQIAFYLEVENTAGFDSGWTNDPANEEYDYMDYGTASNGREYFWDNSQLVPLLNGIGDSSVTDLLSQAAVDFPGGVIYWVEVDGESGYIEVTRWEAYADYSAGYIAYYTLDGDTWVLDSAEQW